jgi:hypothetical protein
VRRRSISTADCDEATLASTFVAAIILDPSREPRAGGGAASGAATRQGAGAQNADAESVPATGAENGKAASVPTSQASGASQISSPTSPADADDVKANSGELRPETARTVPRSRRQKRVKKRGPRSSLAFGGARAVLDWGPAPHVLYGLALYGGMTSTKGGWWAPGFEFQGGYQWSRATSEPAGSAQFRLGLLALRLCPSQARIGPVRLRGCLATRGGWMWANGTDTYQPGRVIRPWVDVGPSVGAAVPLGSGVGFSANVDLGFALVRDTFQFDDKVFHQAAPVVVSASLGLLVDFL